MTRKRWGRTGPTLLVALFYFVGAALLLASPGQLGFLAAATAFQFGTNLGSYAFGAISEADPSGRMSVTYLLSLKADFAAGPLVASWRVAGDSYGPIISLGIVVSLIVCVLIVAQIRVAHVLVTRTS